MVASYGWWPKVKLSHTSRVTMLRSARQSMPPSKRTALACPSIEAISIGWMKRRHGHCEQIRPPGRTIFAVAVQEGQNETRQRYVSA